MSIRLRLLLSYFAMILVPVLFAVLSAALVALLFRGDIKELRSIYLPSEHHHTVSEDNQLFKELHYQSITNPNRFTDRAYLNGIDDQLKKTHTSLVLRKGKKILYVSKTFSKFDTEDLPSFGFDAQIDPVERIDHQFVSLKQLDFFFKDNSEGSLFFVRDASGLARFVRSFFPVLFIGLIAILIITNGLLTYFVSKSIIRPIKDLQRAAKHIKEGDLHIPVEVKSKDELGQLAMGFEEMRKRLKDSIDIQVAYEENRKELIANISHDLKTPITTIKGYVEGIRDGVANNREKMERYLQTIYTKAIDLDHMIDELFLYSKLDLQRLPFHFEIIRFDHYLQDLVDELRFDFDKKKVAISLEIDKNGKYDVKGDREHLKRVITNIVDNSIKYIDKEEKQLYFHLSSSDDSVTFLMRDNGPGIEVSNLPFIFDRFYRADLARGTEKGGSGLGLSIAKRIIEEHQGTIWAESVPGEGTAILFTLKKTMDLSKTEK